MSKDFKDWLLLTFSRKRDSERFANMHEENRNVKKWKAKREFLSWKSHSIKIQDTQIHEKIAFSLKNSQQFLIFSILILCSFHNNDHVCKIEITKKKCSSPTKSHLFFWTELTVVDAENPRKIENEKKFLNV